MEEVTYGVAPGPAGATLLRRISIDLDLSKDTYESDEIIKTYQVSDFRHGMRKVGGTLKGRLSPGSYSKFIGYALRKEFAVGGTITAATLASVSATGFTDSGTGFLTAGFKVGDVVSPSGFTGANVGNNGNYYIVTSVVAGTMNVVNMDGTAATIAGDAAGESVTIAAIGKKSFVPSSGHTNKSVTVEKLFGTTTPISELYTGCKLNSVDVSLPATGLAGIDFGFMGQNRSALGTAGYFTTPTAASTTGLTAAVNGAVLFAGSIIAVITGMTFKVDGGMSTGAVVGSNITPDVFVGRVKVSGQLTAYLQDSTLIAAFDAETEVSIIGIFTVSNAVAPKFVSFVMPRVKLGGATKSDGEGPVVITAPFTALYNSAGGTGTSSEQSTLVCQDSDAA
jgi:hypothetical protein